MRRILLLMAPQQNRTLLEEDLSAHYDVRTGSDAAALDGEMDMVIMDGPTLDRCVNAIRERREAELPVLLPSLLITSRPEVRMITRHLWRSLDELLVTPIERLELKARVEVLLRARSLSLELRQRALEAEHAARSRDQVLAVVSHDLRNPLNTISMASGIIGYLGVPEERRLAQVGIIGRAVDQMNRLIGDLLDVAQIASGRFGITPRPVAPRDLLRAAADQAAPLALARGVEVEVRTADGLPTVLVDEQRVQQVFGNLTANGAAHTAEGGRLTITARAQEGEVCFTVADTGEGIAAEDLPHVFDHFWRAASTERRGAGLGLAIARGIVEAHGGRIWAESGPGEGTRMHFTVPAAPARGHAGAAPSG